MEYSAHDRAVLARTLWGEARGEGTTGKIAVAHVMLNRANNPRFAGRMARTAGGVAYVCQAPAQFSCWNDDDPNRTKLLVLDVKDCPSEFDIAGGVLDGTLPDPTGGADHYHTTDPLPGYEWPPEWATKMKPCGRFGAHDFYQSVDPLMRLSDNFALSELVATENRWIDNTPTYAALLNLRQTAAMLEQARRLCGGYAVIVTSGYRCPALNRAVGGSNNSEHMDGRAADFIIPRAGSPLDVCRRLAASDIRFNQLIYEAPRGVWVHMSWSAKPRREVLHNVGGQWGNGLPG